MAPTNIFLWKLTKFSSFSLSFQAYGRDLSEAYDWCRKFQTTSNVKDLTQAWELYYHVFRRISKQLPQVCMSVHLICCLSSQSAFLSNFSPVLLSLQLTTLELQYVSPKLLECQDLELAIPGTYEPHQDVIHIKKVSPSLNVITSKQRPRKLIMEGVNTLCFLFASIKL